MATVPSHGYTAYITALTLFQKYAPDDTFVLRAEHDCIYASETPPETMEPSDAKQLESLGWLWDESLECWMCYT